MPGYDVSGPIDLDVTVGVAFVDIVASDRRDAVVEVAPSRPGRSGDESLARESTVSFDGGRMRVKVPRRLNLFGKGDSVDVRCEVPTGSRVTIENAYGSVRARGVLGDARLDEEHGPLRIDAAREELRCHLQSPRRQLFGFVILGNRVIVYDADEGPVLLLQLYPVVDGPQIVAEVKLARGLDPAENRFHCVMSLYLLDFRASTGL